MRKYLTNIFDVGFSFYIFIAAFLLLVPLRIAIAWLVAVATHELSHYIALRMFRVSVFSLKLRAFGVVMDTAPMSGKKEVACALAGPLGGLCLLAVARWMPCTAICAVIHSGYNLLPIYPLDGGRALRRILSMVFGNRTGQWLSKIVSYAIIGVLFVLAIYLTWNFHMGILPVCFVLLLMIRCSNIKFPCKQLEQIVQ